MVDLRPGVVRPVLLICAALLALGAVYFGAVRLNVYPPVATWLALALGALLAPVAVFVRVYRPLSDPRARVTHAD